jgi:hypothetical protein
VKFPLNEGTKKKPDYNEGIEHSRAEVRRILKLAKVKELRPHLPAVHYYDRSNGIMVMTWYPKLSEGWNRIDLMENVIRKLVRRIAHTTLSDSSGDNIRMAGKPNRLILVDLGY